jgi:hypothetical protein
MKRNGFLGRMVKIFGVVAVMVIIGSLLLACGEEEDIGGNVGTGGNAPAATPTPGAPAVTPTPNAPVATPTPNVPVATPTPNAPTPGPVDPRIDYATGSDDLVLRVEYVGGFVMLEHLMTRLPILSLTGDGCFVYQGPQIMIYPPPALPNLLVTCVNDEGMQAILQAAKDAGLLDGNAHYDVDTIADAATTVFTINADGKSYVISAYALSADEIMVPGVSREDAEARARLDEFLKKMSDPRGWLPQDTITTEERFYEIERLQVVAQPLSSPNAPAAPDYVEKHEIAWPLATPLATFGEEFLGNTDLRCDVVEGDDLGLMLRVMENASTLTNWTSEGESYYLYLKPLTAGEVGCEIPEVARIAQ